MAKTNDNNNDDKKNVMSTMMLEKRDRNILYMRFVDITIIMSVLYSRERWIR